MTNTIERLHDNGAHINAAASAASVGESVRVLGRRRFIALARADTVAIQARLGNGRANTQDEDDLPVLTDIIAATAPLASQPAAAVAQATSLAQDLVDIVNRQVSEQLPTLLEESLARLGNQLQQGLTSLIHRSIASYLAEHAAPGSPAGDHYADKSS